MNARQCPMCGTDQRDGEQACQCGYVFSTPGQTGRIGEPTSDAAAPSWGAAVGWVLMAGGIVAVAASFLMTVTVEGSYGSETYNIGLMQKQMMVLACGLASAVSGVIVLALRRT